MPEIFSSIAAHSPDPLLADWLTLSLMPGVGCTLGLRLVHHFGSPAQVLSARTGELLAVDGVGPKTARMLTDAGRLMAGRERAIREIGEAARQNCTILCPFNDCYPRRLLEIEDPPAVLFCRGNMELIGMPTVAVVGSRAATSYGKRVGFDLGRALARYGICVVSGMAMGIDGEAQAGALAAEGMTIGVLGCGIDVVYPYQHKELFAQVAARGLLISEYPSGTKPDGFRFPERNRIISGLSFGTVVVEASVKSGSLITASLAMEQGREVFAVPGRIDSPKSRGCHRLVQQGAKLVTSVDDIMEELELAGMLSPGMQQDCTPDQAVSLQREEKHLLSCLDVYPMTIDELVRDSGFEAGTIFQMLVGLELKGMVRQLPGQQYELRGVPDLE